MNQDPINRIETLREVQRGTKRKIMVNQVLLKGQQQSLAIMASKTTYLEIRQHVFQLGATKLKSKFGPAAVQNWAYGNRPSFLRLCSWFGGRVLRQENQSPVIETLRPRWLKFHFVKKGDKARQRFCRELAQKCCRPTIRTSRCVLHLT